MGGFAATDFENYYCSLTDDPNVSIADATAMLSDYNGLSGFDPISIIQNMNIPVLWICGNEDRSHPARYDVQILEMLVKPRFTVSLYPNTNHDLVDLSTSWGYTSSHLCLGE